MLDTPVGFSVTLVDLTTGQTGSMTASIANGFQQVVFDPDSPDPKQPRKQCSELPYAFHPMFSTSSEHTRLGWTAQPSNIAFAAELGHFESPEEPDDSDGGQDIDFDGASYDLNWPGT